MAESGEAVRVASGPGGVKSGHVGHENEEIGSRGAGPGIGKRYCSGHIVKAGLARRLMRDRWKQLSRIRRNATLDQSSIDTVLILNMHSSIEVLAVEAMSVDIMEEVGRRDWRMAAVERDNNPAHAGIDSDGDQIFLGGRSCRRWR